MSREEARHCLQAIKFMLDMEHYSDEVEQALNIAIEALRDIDDIERIIERNRDMCGTDRLYIKIYADSEPGTKAEKLYQICTTDELVDVLRWLQEYCKCEEL